MDNGWMDIKESEEADLSWKWLHWASVHRSFYGHRSLQTLKESAELNRRMSLTGLLLKQTTLLCYRKKRHVNIFSTDAKPLCRLFSSPRCWTFKKSPMKRSQSLEQGREKSERKTGGGGSGQAARVLINLVNDSVCQLEDWSPAAVYTTCMDLKSVLQPITHVTTHTFTGTWRLGSMPLNSSQVLIQKPKMVRSHAGVFTCRCCVIHFIFYIYEKGA